MRKLKAAAVLLIVVLVLSLAACRSNTASQGKGTESAGSTVTENIVSDGAENYTKYADYTPQKAAPKDLEKGENSNILIAYFSRSGNTAVDSSVDAVTSASLVIRDDGTTLGNTEQIARWIAEETGGDLFLIQTEYTYPTDYDQTVMVGEGQDRDGYHPTLISHVENMDQYDTVYLVYPIWHYTLSVPTCSFLDEYDLTGKTVYAFAANAGSRFADSIQRIQEEEPGATVIEGISLSEREINDGRDAVLAFVIEHMPAPETAATAGTAKEQSEATTQDSQQDHAEAQEENKDMKLMIGSTEVTVAWEDNASVEALKELVSGNPLSVSMSMYGGFEQVGSLGTSLTRDDRQTTTQAGDIVLYSGNQIVIFYGSNSWSYTRLGHITDQSASGMADLLGNGDVTITITLE